MANKENQVSTNNNVLEQSSNKPNEIYSGDKENTVSFHSDKLVGIIPDISLEQIKNDRLSRQ